MRNELKQGPGSMLSLSSNVCHVSACFLFLGPVNLEFSFFHVKAAVQKTVGNAPSPEWRIQLSIEYCLGHPLGR